MNSMLADFPACIVILLFLSDNMMKSYMIETCDFYTHCILSPGYFHDDVVKFSLYDLQTVELLKSGWSVCVNAGIE